MAMQSTDEPSGVKLPNVPPEALLCLLGVTFTARVAVAVAVVFAPPLNSDRDFDLPECARSSWLLVLVLVFVSLIVRSFLLSSNAADVADNAVIAPPRARFRTLERTKDCVAGEEDTATATFSAAEEAATDAAADANVILLLFFYV